MVTEPAPKASRCSEGSAWKPALSPVARGKGIVLRCVCMGYRFGHTAQGSCSVTGLRHVPKQSLLCAAFKNYVCCVYGVNVPHQTYWRTFFFKELTGLLILILLLKQMSLSHPEEKLSSPHPTPCSLSLSLTYTLAGMKCSHTVTLLSLMSPQALLFQHCAKLQFNHQDYYSFNLI